MDARILYAVKIHPMVIIHAQNPLQNNPGVIKVIASLMSLRHCAGCTLRNDVMTSMTSNDDQLKTIRKNAQGKCMRVGGRGVFFPKMHSKMHFLHLPVDISAHYQSVVYFY